jgi:hypothetical protein
VDAPALGDVEGLALLEVEADTGGVEDVPRVTSPTGTVIGPPVSWTCRAADQAVGGLQRDGADHVVADVLGDLEVDVLGLAGEFDLGGQQVVLVGHRVGRELDVDDRADDAGDAADAAGLGGVLWSR